MAPRVDVGFPRLGVAQADLTVAASTEFVFTPGADLTLATSTQGVWVRQGLTTVAAAVAGGAGCFLIPKDTMFQFNLGKNDRIAVIEDAATARFSVVPSKLEMDAS